MEFSAIFGCMNGFNYTRGLPEDPYHTDGDCRGVTSIIFLYYLL